MNIVLLGSPGAGKGTYSERVKELYSLKHISMGDVIRDQVSRETKVGLKAKEYTDKGNLVPDNVVIELLKSHLDEIGHDNLLLDGFPRTVAQAEALEDFLNVDYVFNLKISEETVIDRLSGRRVCPECKFNYHLRNIPPKKEGYCDDCNVELIHRDDDKPEAIRERLKTYHKKTEPLVEYYRAKGKLYDINADKSIKQIDEVIAEFSEVLG